MRLTSKICLLLMVCAVSTNALSSSLKVELSASPSNGEVRVKLTNFSGDDISVLRWNTPFEATLSHNIFLVSNSKKALPFAHAAPFMGRHVNRKTPSAEDYFSLAPGQSVVADVPLAQYYLLDKSDQYGVRFSGKFRYLSSTPLQKTDLAYKQIEELLVQPTMSNAVSISLTPEPDSLFDSRARPAAFNGCSVDQQAYIQSATEEAERLTNEATSDLLSLTAAQRSTSPRYTTWFGTYTEGRFNRVVSNFQSIGNALANETIRYDCTCNEANVYAYVYPSRPYDVFLCPVFHSSPEIGTNSRAGTIIHELSHFNVLAGTDDHVYSQQAAQNLAVTSPTMAIDNADSHEYFAENTPSLAISSGNQTTDTGTSTTLTLNTPQSGAVATDETLFFQSSGASSIVLLSNSGDADLFVYSDAQRSQQICRSVRITQTDQCDLLDLNTVYISVYGFEAANYTIEARGGSDISSPQNITQLVLGNTVSAAVAEGDSTRYEVIGADTIELLSVSGDSDLYVYSSSDFNESSLVCSSLQIPEVNPIDACTFPDSESTYYISVLGWSDSNYQLTASTTAIDTTPEVVIASFGALTLGQQVQRTVVEGGQHIYDVSGATTVELTSLSGDADLLIVEGLVNGEGEAVCISAEFSNVSVLDSCDISLSNGAQLQIGVFGYSDSEYTLIARGPENDDNEGGQSIESEDPFIPVSTGGPLPTDDENGDPVVPANDGDNSSNDTNTTGIVNNTGGSSGGALSMLWLLIGLFLTAFRYAHAQHMQKIRV